jgi:DNA-directed RNA polymerase specialized sigma24 family protein
MLTDNQKHLVKKGLEFGLNDPVLAKKIGAKPIDVYKYRHALQISSDYVRERRYDCWLQMLSSGTPLDEVADRYEVKPDTILITLYRKRHFSVPEAKKRAKLAMAEKFRQALGIPADEMRAQQTEVWIRLFNEGMTVEEIAEIYEIKTSEIRAVLNLHVDRLKHRDQGEDIFNW